MRRKSHVRFSEKGVATYWSFDQPPPVNSALGPPLTPFIIGVWGSRQRKIKAAYQFFLYTLLGSVFMLLAILLILLQTGTTDLQIHLTTEFSERRQIFLWIASFASFAVKVPMVPVHIWLPEAHVEAPTAGSVILAGIPLKLGTYGQIDLKKIIAYSSVAHMNLVTIEKKEIDMYLMESTSYIERQALLGQLSSLIHRSNALGSSHGGKSQNVVVLFAASTHSLLSPVSSHTERKSAEPRPTSKMCPAQRERAAQTNVSCYTESPAGHRGPSGKAMICRGKSHSFFHWGQVHERQLQTSHIRRYLPFRWHQRDPAKVRSCRGCSTPLRSDELNFVAFPPAKRMGAVPWVSFGTESEERPEE
ncbi:UNVERIFIED_CONTAM: NADH-ubiquinone oxidoreductase chain 4 [Sesamum calycinum]|uniref:NADH-ubiquinone oxidoreductase chain 4 n=1 Tax=Sesamum calycinum TaxID=2727403 RepID=A0AAW2SBP8_9LAMI